MKPALSAKWTNVDQHDQRTNMNQTNPNLHVFSAHFDSTMIQMIQMHPASIDANIAITINYALSSACGLARGVTQLVDQHGQQGLFLFWLCRPWAFGIQSTKANKFCPQVTECPHSACRG